MSIIHPISSLLLSGSGAQNCDQVLDIYSPFQFGYAGNTSAIAIWRSKTNNPNSSTRNTPGYIFTPDESILDKEFTSILSLNIQQGNFDQDRYCLPKMRYNELMIYYQIKINILFPLILATEFERLIRGYPGTENKVVISSTPKEMKPIDYGMILAVLVLAQINSQQDKIFNSETTNTEGSKPFEATHQISKFCSIPQFTLTKMNILFALYWNKASDISFGREFMWKAGYIIEMLHYDPFYHDPNYCK
ncbi:hypothetical protein SBOR_10029 [Sclerotinia borealis F-4128]|uniref:Uncharacterized protein n=1 Tax=Sclerotinia borealis (strain F-4128) TaxID=1432307 RepID=W9C4T4_SCLBF|nr:hypothetical protein SBOR_10029 [Sclerotinia borealis F-4128]